MRYVLAIVVLALSGVMLVLGIGQRTFLAGPAEISLSVNPAPGTAYAVIPSSVFDEVHGQPNVEVSGENAFVATGSTLDVEAWVAPFDHVALSVDIEGRQLQSTAVTAASDIDVDADADTAAEEETEELEPIDPRGSDLWLEERSATTADEDGTEETEGEAAESTVEPSSELLRVPIAMTADQSVIVAANGSEPISGEISVVWVQERSTPFAGPLLAAGGLFALIGGILYLLAIDHNRRGLGPRRGRRGPLQGIRNVFGGRRRHAKRAAAAAEGGADESDAGGRDTDASNTKAPNTGEPGVSDRGSEASGTGEQSAGNQGRNSMRVRARVLPAIGLVALLGLSGCSPSYWPDFSVPPAEEEEPEATEAPRVPVPVTEPQLERIVGRIAQTATESDENLDEEMLEARFVGDALEQRAANYTIRQEVENYEVTPLPITDEGLGYDLVQSTETWPRTILATVASEAQPADEDEAATENEESSSDDTTDDELSEEPQAPSLALLMTQENPHENYLVSRVIRLGGGISMPEAAPTEEGTALLANDLQSLVLPPEEVGPSYAEVLAEGTDIDAADYFQVAEDGLLAQSGAAWAEEANAQASDNDETVQYSVQARESDSEVVSLSTGVGGALVATTVVEDRIEDSDGERMMPTVSDSMAALSGLSGRQDVLVREISHQMLFFVPSESSGAPIEVLGVSTGMVGVRDEE